MRETADDGQDGWGIQVWFKGSDQDGPEDQKFRVLNGSVIDQDVELAEKEAVMAPVEQWEDRLPLMAASPPSYNSAGLLYQR